MGIKTRGWVRRPYFGNQWAMGKLFFKVQTEHSGPYYTFLYSGWETRNKNSETELRNLVKMLVRFSLTLKSNSSNLYYRTKIWAMLLTPANRSYCESFFYSSRESSYRLKKPVLVTFHYRSIWSPTFQLRLLCWPSQREKCNCRLPGLFSRQ